ncbi:MAG: preprotein translocase subunit YajC [Planctomycetota bacterium]|jgi:preprotein translocase subunit YajC
MNTFWILAQAETSEAPSEIGSTPVTENGEYEGATKSDGSPPDPNAGGGGGRGPGGLLSSPWPLVALMVVMFYFVLFRGPRKKQQQHKQMVQSLQRNDKVRTVGGIIGTIVDVKGDEITLKVDEANNTKIKIASSAIGRNLSKDTE